MGLDYQIQSYEGQSKDEFYVHPFYSANAVIRILNFDQLRCGKQNVKIFKVKRGPIDESELIYEPVDDKIDWVCIDACILFSPYSGNLRKFLIFEKVIFRCFDTSAKL